MGVAITGIAVPIGLSFSLRFLANATPLQSFAAGAALCSTSLGTTVTVLRTSGLTNTRLGVILTSAAMMDDVVGLVMVQVISNIGSSSSSFDPVTVIRPIFTSIGLVVILAISCRLLLQLATIFLIPQLEACRNGKIDRLLRRRETALVFHTTFLLCLVTGATYAGTSNLFAAYLAGAVISWWDTEALHEDSRTNSTTINVSLRRISTSVSQGEVAGHDSRAVDPSEPHEIPNTESIVESVRQEVDTSGLSIYRTYYQQGVERILKPFFFASIGFSIPISKMFAGPVVWRGIIYSILMIFGKMTCGIWLLRFSLPRISRKSIRLPYVIRNVSISSFYRQHHEASEDGSNIAMSKQRPSIRQQQPSTPTSPVSTSGIGTTTTTTQTANVISPRPTGWKSLYPPAIISFAMVARGEIGFLISSLAQSKGVLGSSSSSSVAESELFLIITWAIVLCTVVGPVCVGLLVRRVKRLEKESQSNE